MTYGPPPGFFPAPAPPQPKRGWKTLPRAAKIGICAGGGAILAGAVTAVLLATVTFPNQGAARAGDDASASASAEESALVDELAAAEEAFAAAQAACEQANQSLASAVSRAQTTAQTDPATLQDPTLIDRLSTEIATAETVPECVPPAMAGRADDIMGQTADLEAATAAVASAVAALDQANHAVPASAQAKQQAEAEAEAARQQAAKQGQFTITDHDGYTYLFTIDNAEVTATIDTTQGKPGEVLVRFGSGRTQVTVTNTTTGKAAPALYKVEMIPLYNDDPCDAAGLAHANSPCASVSFASATYWTVRGLQMTWHPNDYGQYGVSESKTSVWEGVTPYKLTEWTVPETNAPGLRDSITSPTSWLVYSGGGISDPYDSYCSGETVITTDPKSESYVFQPFSWTYCLLGGTDSLDLG
jgi:hypothetical protein